MGSGSVPSARANGAPASTVPTRRSQMTVADKARFIKEFGVERLLEIPF